MTGAVFRRTKTFCRFDGTLKSEIRGGGGGTNDLRRSTVLP